MKAVAALVLAAGLSGCGTIVNLTVGTDTGVKKGGSAFGGYLGGTVYRTEIYGGILNDIHTLDDEFRRGGWYLLLVPWIALIDFPLSLAADTATLIITVPVVLTREEDPPPPKASSP